MVYVDAYLNDRTSMRAEYGACLRGMGADVRVRLPKKMETLTHLVWKDGDEGSCAAFLPPPPAPVCLRDLENRAEGLESRIGFRKAFSVCTRSYVARERAGDEGA